MMWEKVPHAIDFVVLTTDNLFGGRFILFLWTWIKVIDKYICPTANCKKARLSLLLIRVKLLSKQTSPRMIQVFYDSWDNIDLVFIFINVIC